MAKSKGPSDREAAASVAYLRICGSTQKEAAEAVGISERTVRNWELSDWWSEIEAEASRRWLKGASAQARRALHSFAATDPATARFLGERLIPELAPPRLRQSLKLTGKAGGPVVVEVPPRLNHQEWMEQVVGAQSPAPREKQDG